MSHAATPHAETDEARLTISEIGSYQGAFGENSSDGNRFGNRVLNYTHFHQSGVCLQRARLN
jgi:hypothetical protein